MRQLYWHRVLEDIRALRSRLDRLSHNKSSLKFVHGIPRGGQIVAAVLCEGSDWEFVSHGNNLNPDTVVIIDDIVDSGKTIQPWIDADYNCDALYKSSKCQLDNRDLSWTARPTVSGEWVEFPWEQGTTGPEDAVTRLLQWIGEDPNRSGLVDTPKRVTKAYKEMCSGYKMVPTDVLEKTFEGDGYDEMIVEAPIEFTSLCEHHMLPFVGSCAVGYIPKKRVVGASKLARLVNVFSKRLQIQERLTEQIASTLMGCLDCEGVGVIMKAKHACMGCRGVLQRRSNFITSSLHGAMRKPETRMEFLTLVGTALD